MLMVYLVYPIALTGEPKMIATVSLDDLKKNLLKRHDGGESWADMGREFGVITAIVWRIAKEGYEPKGIETRKKLGLPELVTHEVYRNERGRFVGK